MWAEALTLLDEAERLQRQFFRLAQGGPGEDACAPGVTAWEPPIDLVESAECIVVTVALPGVAAEHLTVTMAADAVTITGARPFPATAPDARILRVEIPYGRFVRRVPLPMRRLEMEGRALCDGCLTLTFRKKEEVVE
jgi:HSP20 family molecular chaperone IbpA